MLFKAMNLLALKKIKIIFLEDNSNNLESKPHKTTLASKDLMN